MPPTAEERAAQPGAGAVRNILTPGSRGNYGPVDVARFQADGTRPANTVDQLALYDALNTIAPQDMTEQTLQELFKDADLGVDPADVVETVRPRDGVTVLRDRFGVPHVYGVTDPDTAYGAGFVGTQDRMFLQDVLRHVGSARLSEFLGPSPGNLAMDVAQLRVAAYTEEETEQQIEKLTQRYPGEGEELQRRLDGYLEGINDAQRELCPVPAAPSCPAEYAALQVVPDDWTRSDIVYIASLVGAIFGKGGGAELDNAQFLTTLTDELGAADGREVFEDLLERQDPEAPTTLEQPFRYEQLGAVDPAAVRLPDAGAPTAPGTGNDVSPVPVPDLPSAPGTVDGPLGPIDLGLKQSGMSNALVVNGSETVSGRPLAVFGPQVGYFAPQILAEVDLHGPHYAARGASFAGTSFIVELGRGIDYAWSATSANNDNVDTVAEQLCNEDESPPSVESTSYLDAEGECVPLDRYVHRQVAKPSAGGPGLPQVIDLEVLRTRHGIVQERTLSGGVPHAYVLERSTYGGEFDSAIGFMRINDPTFVRSARDFQRAFAAVDYTFNWFYVDSRDAGYYNSGLLPLREPGVDPALPRSGAARWDVDGFLSDDRHAQAVNPPKGWMTSWNNKPAPGIPAADDQYAFGSVYRSLSLDVRLTPLLAGEDTVSLPELTGMMMDAGTADVRGQQLLPELLAVVGEDPARTTELALLRDWQTSGANRVDRDRDGAYAHESAIALFDAWWEDAATTVLRGTLGDLVDAVPSKIDDHPRVTPGGFNAVGWYGYVDKDLRQVLGREVRGRYSRTYCGGGSLGVCRDDMRASLARAADAVAAEQGTDEPRDWTFDKSTEAITSTTLGLVGVPTFDFQNRPTFQQVVAFSDSRQESAAAQPSSGAAAAQPASPPTTQPAVPPAAQPRAVGVLATTGPPMALPLLALFALAGALLVRRRR